MLYQYREERIAWVSLTDPLVCHNVNKPGVRVRALSLPHCGLMLQALLGPGVF